MKSSSTIRMMLSGNKITVPNYQRAYSWDTPQIGKNRKTQTDIFISDLEQHQKSSTNSPYYFGHFLYEEKNSVEYKVIDGQQRLTTIIIFLSALFFRLKVIRNLTEEEEIIYEDIIKRRSNVIFSTVEYDNMLFKDYVIDQNKIDKIGLETVSAHRIVDAFIFFSSHLILKDEAYLTSLLNIISNATCTTHCVINESEAIQMFLFQNNRGKKPTNLELVKAQFMFQIHLNAIDNDEKESLLIEIKYRFERIYKSISSIEYNIDEDDVLNYTLQIYFNSLGEVRVLDKINENLKTENCLYFIKEFTRELSSSFEKLTIFFTQDEKKYFDIHSLQTLGGISIAIPFIIKAYNFEIDKTEFNKLCNSLESLILRHRLIGTKAIITSRINDTYQQFTIDNSTIQPIIDRINLLKNTDNDWWGYWNNLALERSIQGYINPSIGKFLLWKYEILLRNNQNKDGYFPMRFDTIKDPELEHIAPQTATKGEPSSTGYCEYDEDFKNQYLECLGNYLLISKPHNCSISNKPFKVKCTSYLTLVQHAEISQIHENNPIWTKDLIKERKNKIVKFILETL